MEKIAGNSYKFKEIKIPSYGLLKKSIMTIPMRLDNRKTDIMLSPLMISNSMVISGSTYMADKTTMLYTTMIKDPTVQFSAVEKVKDSYDTISYSTKENSSRGILVLTLSTGDVISVVVSKKVGSYAIKLSGVDSELKNYLIAAMYIYSRLDTGYSYPISIITNTTVVAKIDDGRFIVAKPSEELVLPKLTRAQEMQIKTIKEVGEKLLIISKKLNIDYKLMTTLMSMIQYLIGHVRADIDVLYGNKYVDFIMKEMIDYYRHTNKANIKHSTPTIEVKRTMISYLYLYRTTIAMFNLDKPKTSDIL